MKGKIIFLLSAMFGLAACEPEELPAPAHQGGTSVEATVDMGADYEYQIFYSLEHNRVVAQNRKTDWDLGFESGPEGFHVILNSSKFMSAWNTGQTAMNQVNDTSGFAAGKRLDAAGGDMDSTAIGDWRNTQNVYIIDRGITLSGSLGLVKLQVTSVDESAYELTFQSLNGEAVHSRIVPKTDSCNFSFLSFDGEGKIVAVEPPKSDWDICFTQYTVEIPIPYLVTGVLLNPARTEAAKDSLTAFEAIDLSFASQLLFSTRRDAIGYDWKTYDFEQQAYRVNPAMNYIIRAAGQHYYKLHFTDFYNAQGLKGNPVWQFEAL